MLDLKKIKKLTVGDIAAYERHVKEEKKRELIALTKDLYGDKIPDDAVIKIEREIKAIPSIFETGEVDAEAVQYLLWLSYKKADADITLQQVGDNMDAENLHGYIEQLLPQPEELPEPETKKKRSRKAKKRTNIKKRSKRSSGN